jgi:hypothetical protein
MRKALLLTPFFFLISAAAVFACSCMAPPDINEQFIRSGFTGTVKIIETENINNYQYSIQIEPILSFKGEAPAKLIAAGRTEGPVHGSMCEISLKPGQEWLLSLTETEEGDFLVNTCSYASLSKSSDGNLVREKINSRRISHLQQLKRLIPNLNRPFVIEEKTGRLNEFLSTQSFTETEETTSHYLIHFNTDLKIQEIEIQSGLGENFDQKMIDYVKNETEWEIHTMYNHEGRETDPIRYLLSIHVENNTPQMVKQF